MKLILREEALVQKIEVALLVALDFRLATYRDGPIFHFGKFTDTRLYNLSVYVFDKI